MRNSALQERRNRQILADIVRAYIETGEPVSSRAISKGFEETLSTATVRNVMADLEDGGFLYQPHTSAGRGPTAAAYRFFFEPVTAPATAHPEDRLCIPPAPAPPHTPPPTIYPTRSLLPAVSCRPRH